MQPPNDGRMPLNFAIQSQTPGKKDSDQPEHGSQGCGCKSHLQHAAVEVPDVEVQAGERLRQVDGL